MNLWIEEPNYKNLTQMHLYTWKSGLKTGMYYLRTKSAVNAIQFTLSKEKKEVTKEEEAIAPVSNEGPMSAAEFKAMVDSSKNGGPDDDCLMCGS